MAFDLKQSLRMTQQLLMTPQLQQAIKLLQLSRLELEEFIQEQIAENPVLEDNAFDSPEQIAFAERETERTENQVIEERFAEVGQLVGEGGGKDQELDWENYSRHQETAAPTSSTQDKRSDDEFPNYENMVSKSGNIQDHLLTQVGEQELEDEEKRVAATVIGNIDDRGYLTCSIEDMAEQLQTSAELVEDMLDVIQRMDPPGVGARDLKECLLLQLRQRHLKNGIVEKIISDHLPQLETRDFPTIARVLKISIEKVIENVQIIADLEPIPGRQYTTETPQYIIPDVYVYKVGEEWVVSMNEEGIPRLKVSDTYQGLMDQKKTTAKDREYLNEKVKSANWLIKSIQQRQRTIYRVTEKIVERQTEFFERGMEHLRPMILKDIADDISMHESTISRVTNNKYVHTPQGIFELKFFFNSSVGKSDGDSLASASVKRMISDLVKEEDVKRPLSDQRIVEILEERGIQLARRTVAKYREQLNILPSSRRKKVF